jgi:hypothetical protein
MVTKDWTNAGRVVNASTSSDLVAQELASVPRRVWTEAERGVVHPDQMWEENLRARAREATMAERRDWE